MWVSWCKNKYVLLKTIFLCRIKYFLYLLSQGQKCDTKDQNMPAGVDWDLGRIGVSALEILEIQQGAGKKFRIFFWNFTG